METRPFGDTGLDVTPLGFGGAEIGNQDLDDEQATRLLRGALDAGIRVIDTAPCYGESELKIGKAVADRRDEYVLVTKCGHARNHIRSPDWTGENITECIDQSLRRLRTDHVDLLLLHSCEAKKLDDEDMLAALGKAREAGKTRLIGYSGDADAAEKAVGMDLFDAIETSVNLADQQGINRHLPAARERKLGVIAKRPIANACWKGLENLRGFYKDYARPYVQRMEAMGLSPQAAGFDGSWIELALRFSAHCEGVCTAIVGSTDLDHLKKDIEIVQAGPLPKHVIAAVRRLWSENDPGDWVGLT